MRRISWAIFAVAIVQLCLVLVRFQNLASPAFLIVSAGMGIGLPSGLNFKPQSSIGPRLDRKPCWLFTHGSYLSSALPASGPSLGSWSGHHPVGLLTALVSCKSVESVS